MLYIPLVVLSALMACQCEPVRHVSNSFGVRYEVLDVPKDVEGLPATVLELNSCFHYARSIDEPFTDRYALRKAFSLSYPWTEVQRAVWKWEGRFSRRAFDEVVNTKPRCGCGLGCCGCSGCDQAMYYKIIGGRLWKREDCETCTNRVRTAEELLKVTMNLFPLPDMEFALWFADPCPSGLPAIGYSLCRNATEGGFTMPSYGVWMSALGPTQLAAYHSCLWERYPPRDRIPLAVWRGSSTNPEPITAENYLRAPRLRVHMLSRNHSDILDARLTHLTPRLANELHSLFTDIAERINAEDLNRYCAMLHLDGNGWSDRFGQFMIHYPTQVLRVASNITTYFDHTYPPNAMVDTFKSDFSDFIAKVRTMIRDCHDMAENATLLRRLEQRQLTARAFMDHVGVAEAMAYSLLVYKNHTGFDLDPSLAGFHELNMTCCQYNKLPHKFTKAMLQRWSVLRGKG